MPEKPFFIGWESEAAPSIRQFVMQSTVGIVIFGAVVAVLTTSLQRTLSTGTFDFGNVQEFEGTLIAEPVPMLMTQDGFYYLVNEFKHGFPANEAKRLHFSWVNLRGTLIEDEAEEMIEVVSGSIESDASGSMNPIEMGTIQDSVALRGEIVDAKCFLGVMNPGRFKPHRACAIRCIEGGIPPLLVAEDSTGTSAYYIIVGPNGEAINNQILDYVAEPVEVTGELRGLEGGRLVLFMDPTTIKRL